MAGKSEMEKLAQQVWLRDILQSGRALQLVQKAGFTFAEVAEQCGVTKPTAWHWLHGNTVRPRPAAANRLATLLRQLEVITRDR